VLGFILPGLAPGILGPGLALGFIPIELMNYYFDRWSTQVQSSVRICRIDIVSAKYRRNIKLDDQVLHYQFDGDRNRPTGVSPYFLRLAGSAECTKGLILLIAAILLSQ